MTRKVFEKTLIEAGFKHQLSGIIDEYIMEYSKIIIVLEELR